MMVMLAVWQVRVLEEEGGELRTLEASDQRNLYDKKK